MEVINICILLLMIIVGKYGFTCQRRRVKHSIVLRNSRFLLKTKVVSSLRSDRGGEYVLFNKYFVENDIRHQKTVRCTPQQNVFAKRKNRTIMELE